MWIRGLFRVRVTLVVLMVAVLTGCPNDPIEYQLVAASDRGVVLLAISGCDRDGLSGSLDSSVEFAVTAVGAWLNGRAVYQHFASGVERDGFVEVLPDELAAIEGVDVEGIDELVFSVRFRVKHSTTDEMVEHVVSFPYRDARELLAATPKPRAEVSATTKGICFPSG
jgi:hypothetical protein